MGGVLELGAETYGSIRWLVIAVPLLALSGGPRGTATADDSKKAELIGAYEPAQKRLREVYSHASITAVSTRKGSPGLNGDDQATKLEIYVDGDKLRVDRINQGANKETNAWVANPSQSFLVTRKLGAPSFSVKAMYASYNEAIETARLRSTLATAPFGFLEVTIDDFIKNPDLKIVAFERSIESDESVAIVRYEILSSDGESVTEAGQFVFLPERAWVLSEYKRGAKGAKRFQHGIRRYGEPKDGVPVLRSVEYWIDAEDGSKALWETFDVQEIKFGRPSAELFTLSAFGIDVRPPSGINRTFAIVSLIMGALLLYLAIAFRRRARPKAPPE